MDKVFSVVIEQKLFNQPVEVRVRSGGLGFLLGKISGGLEPFFKFSFSRRYPCPLPFNRPLPAAETMSVR